MRVGGDGAAVSRSERADVRTLTDRFEKPGERVNAARARTVRAGRRGRRHGRLYQGEWGRGVSRAEGASRRRDLARHFRCRCSRGTRCVVPVDGGANISNGRPRRTHLHRATRDVEADRSSHAVGIPPGDSALTISGPDKTIDVGPMPVCYFASAEARDVAQYLRMARGEFVCCTHDLHRPG